MSALTDDFGLPAVVGNAIKSIVGDKGVVIMGDGEPDISFSDASTNARLTALSVYYINSMSYFLFDRFTYPLSVEVTSPEEGGVKVVEDESKQLYSGASSKSFKLLLGLDAMLQLSSVSDNRLDLSGAFAGLDNLVSMHEAGECLDEVQLSPLMIGSELASFGLNLEGDFVSIMQDNPDLLSIAMSDVKYASANSSKGLSNG